MVGTGDISTPDSLPVQAYGSLSVTGCVLVHLQAPDLGPLHTTAGFPLSLQARFEYSMTRRLHGATLKEGYGYLTDRTAIYKAQQYMVDVGAQQPIAASVVSGMFVQKSLIHQDGRLR